MSDDRSHITEDIAALLEIERQRLAQQLEQSLISQIQLIMAQVNAYEMTATPQSRLSFAVLSSLVRDLLQRTRDLQNSLHPEVLESLGLETALESLANQIQRTAGTEITLDLARLAQRLPLHIEIQLFRTIETACQVAIEHHAQNIELKLRLLENTLHIFVTDDGQRRELEHYVNVSTQLNISISQAHQHFTEVQIEYDLTPQVDLTPRETEILYWTAQGLTNKQIAAQVQISPRTVKYHLDNVFIKLNASSRTEASIKAMQWGLLDAFDG